MSYNKNTDKVTWKCYPVNVESFGDVSYPIVDNVLEARKSFYENINHIDQLPNRENIPDKVGPTDNFKSPVNMEPVRSNPNTSLEPVIIVTDVEPGAIMPGNLSFSLPSSRRQSNALLYPVSNIPENNESSLHGDVILKSPYVTILETPPVNDPLRMQIDSNIMNVTEIANKYDGLRIMSQQEFNMAAANIVKNEEPAKITNIDQVEQRLALNQKQSLPPISVESYPESKSLPVMNVKLRKSPRRNKNRFIHKVLMYISIALVIYLIYILFYEK